MSPLFQEWVDTYADQYGISVKYKTESIFMKVIGALLFFNKNFMSRFTTTIGRTVYLPSRERVNAIPDVYVGVMWHELVHVLDSQSTDGKFLPGTYSIAYLFPQILSVLSVFALLAFVSQWFLFFLIFLVFLAPIGAPFRTNYEAKAYAMSLNIQALERGSINLNDAIYPILVEFVGPNYYYMCRNSRKVSEKIQRYYYEIQSDHNQIWSDAKLWYSLHR